MSLNPKFMVLTKFVKWSKQTFYSCLLKSGPKCYQQQRQECFGLTGRGTEMYSPSDEKVSLQSKQGINSLICILF